MNEELRRSFLVVKPLCDSIMMCPTEDNIEVLFKVVEEFSTHTIQELQLYILYPILTHIQDGKEKIRILLLKTLITVFKKSSITTSEMFKKYHGSLMGLLVEKNQVDKLSNLPEEQKLMVLDGLITLMLNSTNAVRVKMFHLCKPLLAQTLFICVLIAKGETLRILRITSIECINAYTGVHKSLKIDSIMAELEVHAVNMTSAVLPGICGALVEVTMSNNPGHQLFVASLNCLHSILVSVMNDKHLNKPFNVSTDDFFKFCQQQAKQSTPPTDNNDNKTVIQCDNTQWLLMAGVKLRIIIENIMHLSFHEHWNVRHELAVLSTRILKNSSRTMYSSIPLVLDILIKLSKDENEEVSNLAASELKNYFKDLPVEKMHQILNCVAERFIVTLTHLPIILNNIHDNEKLSSLCLLRGYLVMLCDTCRPQRLTHMLSLQNTLLTLCRALIQTAKLESHIGLLAEKYITSTSYESQQTPWCMFKNINKPCEYKLIDICQLLGGSEGVDLVVDQLLDLFTNSSEDRKEIVYILNHICNGTENVVLLKRVLNMYIEPDVWYLPLEVGNTEAPVTSDETLDVEIYNPRAWEKDSVPGLYEGATETRYTGISYKVPRQSTPKDPSKCANLTVAIDNMIISCLLTTGVGTIAIKIEKEFELYLLKTLCLILERVGSKYEMLNLAGARAINDISRACGYDNVSQLICSNADYFTYQITTRLKKVWNNQSALEILNVVMRNSDMTIFDCLYGIVNDVLVQSCDKHHKNDLSLYLEVFLTFINYLNKWFPSESLPKQKSTVSNGDFRDVIEFIRNYEVSRRLELEEVGKSGEEMFREDEEMRKEDMLHSEDAITEEKSPPPKHITIAILILQRCVNFIPSKRRTEQLLSLDILNEGLKLLRNNENELLPLVHAIWSPFVVRFEETHEPIVLRRAFVLLITMGEVSKEFVSSRVVKEVLPKMYSFLWNSSSESYLQDVGSAYRDSQSYKLQLSMLEALSTLIVDLNLADTNLDDAMDSVRAYLSNKQPKALQELAVKFFRAAIDHDIGAAFFNLRRFCSNNKVMLPNVDAVSMDLAAISQTPFQSNDDSYNKNLELIFGDVQYFDRFVTEVSV